MTEDKPFSVKIKHLHPTQLSVGYEEVDKKVRKMKKLSDKELEDFIYEHIVPIILGPNNTMYIIDHHHFCLAAHILDIDKVYGKIVKDLSELTSQTPSERIMPISYKFWDHMNENKYIWLYDTNGNKINIPEFLSLLPSSIKDLKDDPYRSLAGIVRKEGGYTKDITPFSEFHWANFYRNKIPHIKLTKETIEYAIYLSTIDEAKQLPGFNAVHNYNS